MAGACDEATLWVEVRRRRVAEGCGGGPFPLADDACILGSLGAPAEQAANSLSERCPRGLPQVPDWMRAAGGSAREEWALELCQATGLDCALGARAAAADSASAPAGELPSCAASCPRRYGLWLPASPRSPPG
eukprot:15177245-Alexandrium_andersonii.AAC.1